MTLEREKRHTNLLIAAYCLIAKTSAERIMGISANKNREIKIIAGK